MRRFLETGVVNVSASSSFGGFVAARTKFTEGLMFDENVVQKSIDVAHRRTGAKRLRQRAKDNSAWRHLYNDYGKYFRKNNEKQLSEDYSLRGHRNSFQAKLAKLQNLEEAEKMRESNMKLIAQQLHLHSGNSDGAESVPGTASATESALVVEQSALDYELAALSSTVAHLLTDDAIVLLGSRASSDSTLVKELSADVADSLVNTWCPALHAMAASIPEKASSFFDVISRDGGSRRGQIEAIQALVKDRLLSLNVALQALQLSQTVVAINNVCSYDQMMVDVQRVMRVIEETLTKTGDIPEHGVGLPVRTPTAGADSPTSALFHSVFNQIQLLGAAGAADAARCSRGGEVGTSQEGLELMRSLNRSLKVVYNTKLVARRNRGGYKSSSRVAGGGVPTVDFESWMEPGAALPSLWIYSTQLRKITAAGATTSMETTREEAEENAKMIKECINILSWAFGQELEELAAKQTAATQRLMHLRGASIHSFGTSSGTRQHDKEGGVGRAVGAAVGSMSATLNKPMEKQAQEFYLNQLKANREKTQNELAAKESNINHIELEEVHSAMHAVSPLQVHMTLTILKFLSSVKNTQMLTATRMEQLSHATMRLLKHAPNEAVTIQAVVELLAVTVKSPIWLRAEEQQEVAGAGKEESTRERGDISGAAHPTAGIHHGVEGMDEQFKYRPVPGTSLQYEFYSATDLLELLYRRKHALLSMDGPTCIGIYQVLAELTIQSPLGGVIEEAKDQKTEDPYPGYVPPSNAHDHLEAVMIDLLSAMEGTLHEDDVEALAALRKASWVMMSATGGKVPVLSFDLWSKMVRTFLGEAAELRHQQASVASARINAEKDGQSIDAAESSTETQNIIVEEERRLASITEERSLAALQLFLGRSYCLPLRDAQYDLTAPAWEKMSCLSSTDVGMLCALLPSLRWQSAAVPGDSYKAPEDAHGSGDDNLLSEVLRGFTPEVHLAQQVGSQYDAEQLGGVVSQASIEAELDNYFTEIRRMKNADMYQQ